MKIWPLLVIKLLILSENHVLDVQINFDSLWIKMKFDRNENGFIDWNCSLRQRNSLKCWNCSSTFYGFMANQRTVDFLCMNRKTNTKRMIFGDVQQLREIKSKRNNVNSLWFIEYRRYSVWEVSMIARERPSDR